MLRALFPKRLHVRPLPSLRVIQVRAELRAWWAGIALGAVLGGAAMFIALKA